jgi:nucleoid DNA-binding protein
MNRAELSVIMAAAVGISKTTAEQALNAALDAMVGQLRRGGKITLAGLGSFRVTERKARVGRNAKTGRPIFIAPCRSVNFVQSRELNHAINGWKRAG